MWTAEGTAASEAGRRWQGFRKWSRHTQPANVYAADAATTTPPHPPFPPLDNHSNKFLCQSHWQTITYNRRVVLSLSESRPQRAILKHVIISCHQPQVNPRSYIWIHSSSPINSSSELYLSLPFSHPQPPLLKSLTSHNPIHRGNLFCLRSILGLSFFAEENRTVTWMSNSH